MLASLQTTDSFNPATAKIFMSGRSQAVRLPKAMRFDVDEVIVKRVGDSLLLTPIQRDWAERVHAAFAALGQIEPMERATDWGQSEREEFWK